MNIQATPNNKKKCELKTKSVHCNDDKPPPVEPKRNLTIKRKSLNNAN